MGDHVPQEKEAAAAPAWWTPLVTDDADEPSQEDKTVFGTDASQPD